MTDLSTLAPSDASAYHHAIFLLTLAEETADAERYERAARVFDAIGMTVSADACLLRAGHYREVKEATDGN